MSEVETALLVILSGALAVFLVLAIICSIYLIQVLKSMKRLTAKAEEVGEAIESSVRSISVVKGITSVLESVGKLRGNGNKRR